MATSGTISLKFSTYYTLRLVWSVTSQSVANNTSNVKVIGYLDAGSGHITSSASKKYTLAIDGTPYTGTCTIGVSKNGTVKLFEHTKTGISHNSNGSKSISISASVSIKVTLSGSYKDTISVSGAVSLPTIARASSISSVTSNVTVNGGNASTVNISAKVSSYYHKVKWNIGSYSYTKNAASGTTSVSYAIPVSWLNAIPSAKSGTATVTLTTYTSSSYGTQVGSSVSKTFTITCPFTSGYVPSFTAAVSDAAGYYALIGAWLKGKSKFKVALSSISAKYGAAVSSISITMNGTTYRPAAGSSATSTSGVLTTVGTNTITIKVTDSRGYSTSQSITKTVSAYAAPSFSKLSISRYRYDEETDEYIKDDEGDFARITYLVKITAVGSNAVKKVTVKYYPVINAGNTASVESTSASTTLYVGVDTEYAYMFAITVSDSVSSITYNKSLSSAITIMDILSGGKGVCFGGVATSADEGYISMKWMPKYDHPDSLLKQLELAAGVSVGSYGCGAPVYRKVEKEVIIDGTVTATWDGSNNTLIATLPTEYRPKGNVYILAPCGGKRIARLCIKSTGELLLEWVVAIADGSSYTESVWVQVNIRFFVE